MAEKKKDDPTVSSSHGEPVEGWHEARPIEEADDSATTKKYQDAPDKPADSTVAQVEVRPDEQ
jgi:hypothetical protein